MPKIMKISLNLLKLHIKYLRLFFSGHGVYSDTQSVVGAVGFSLIPKCVTLKDLE